MPKKNHQQNTESANDWKENTKGNNYEDGGQGPRVVYRLGSDKFIHVIKYDFKKFQDILWYHRIVYGLLVFFGLTLIWYGFWKLIEIIPVLNIPGLAVLFGIGVLVLTGSIYKLWE